MPKPTEIAEGEDEGEINRERAEWIESLHRAAPGTDWRVVEQVNWASHLATRNLLRKARGAATPQSVVDPPPWIEVGSLNLAGRTHQVAFHAASGKLYLGSNLGGLWRGDFNPTSPDPSNMNWRPLSDGIHGGALQVLILDGPPLTFLKTSSASPPASAYPAGEIDRSTDGGLTWTIPSSGVGRVRRLLKLANAEETVFAITDSPNQLLRSHDRGATFQMVRDFAGSLGDIWTPRNALGPIYLLSGNKLEVSGDLGATWAPVGTLPWTGSSNAALTASEAGSPTFYTVAQSGGSTAWRLYRSPDGGVGWSDMGPVGDFWGDMVSLSASITDPNLVLYGGTEAWRSTDGGVTFTRVNGWPEYYGDPAHKLHADIPCIGFVPLAGGGEMLFVSTDGGTFYSADAGVSFNNISVRGLNVSQYYSTLSDANDPRQIQAGAQDQGYQTGEAGLGAAFNQVISGDYGQLTSSNGSLDLVYSVYPGFLLIAEKNGLGTTLYLADFPSGDHPFLPSLRADPLDPNSVYFCAQHLYKYTRSGNAWISTPLPFDFGNGTGDFASVLAIARSNTNRWYVATNQGRLWYSTNGGAAWSQSTFASVPAPQYWTGVAMLIDPADPNRVYVGGAGYSNPPVYRSTDGGQTFSPFNAGLPSTLVTALADDPLGGGDVYAATESGPYRYNAAVGAWQSLLGDAAPMTAYWSVERAFDHVRFGTYGRGIWDYVPSQAGCTFAVSPANPSFGAIGGSGVLSVTAGVGCAWSVARLDDWISLTGATKGTGNGSVPYAVASNSATSIARAGHVTLQGQTVTVAQSGAACTYAFSPSALSLGSSAQSAAVGLVTPLACAWSATTTTPWITIPVGVGAGPAGIAFSVSQNTTGVARAGTIQAQGQTFTLTQLAGRAFHTVNPCRVVDTRSAALGGPALVATTSRAFKVADQCGVPVSAGAVSINITVVGPTAPGDLRLHAGGTELPLVSAINYRAGQTRANNAVTVLGSDGSVAVYCEQGSGTVDFVLDVNGYFE